MARSYIEIEDVRRLEAAATCLRNRLLIRILFHSGCRVSEALNLEVRNVDFSECTLTVEHLKSRIKLLCPQCKARLSRSHRFCPICGLAVERLVTEEKEHPRFRTLPLDEGSMAMLKEYNERGGPVVREGKRVIFGINRHRAWQIVKECAEKAGLPKLVNPETGRTRNISPHRLRDAFATHAVKLDDSGDGLRLLQEHLGHASFNTTAKYRKVSGKEHHDWYDKLWQKEGS